MFAQYLQVCDFPAPIWLLQILMNINAGKYSVFSYRGGKVLDEVFKQR